MVSMQRYNVKDSLVKKRIAPCNFSIDKQLNWNQLKELKQTETSNGIESYD